MIINIGNNQPIFFFPKQIERIEDKYKAKHIGGWSILNKLGGWTNYAIDLFWQPEPLEGHSKVFGLYFQHHIMHICAGSSFCPKEGFNALKLKDTYYVSKFRHDYVQVGNTSIDGGREYLRTNDINKICQITFNFDTGEFETC